MWKPGYRLHKFWHLNDFSDFFHIVINIARHQLWCVFIPVFTSAVSCLFPHLSFKCKFTSSCFSSFPQEYLLSQFSSANNNWIFIFHWIFTCYCIWKIKRICSLYPWHLFYKGHSQEVTRASCSSDKNTELCWLWKSYVHFYNLRACHKCFCPLN